MCHFNYEPTFCLALLMFFSNLQHLTELLDIAEQLYKVLAIEEYALYVGNNFHIIEFFQNEESDGKITDA